MENLNPSEKQTAKAILMIEPIAFGYNAETAKNNYFQEKPNDEERFTNQEKALAEFQTMVGKLKDSGIEVLVVKDTAEPHTPDSIFPNNWFSTHANGNIAIYPMFAENRRAERRPEILEEIEEKGFKINDIVDYTGAEEDELFLEGTGSMILDREHRLAYAAISPRTDENLLFEFCEEFEFTPVIFRALQDLKGENKPIYHTNVMMCVAHQYAVICLESILDEKERKNVIKSLKNTGKEIIAINTHQMNNFAGNMLQVETLNGEKKLIMSQSAYNSLENKQLEDLEKYNEIIPVAIPTIEKLGGGSTRCMMAEIFLPKKSE